MAHSEHETCCAATDAGMNFDYVEVARGIVVDDGMGEPHFESREDGRLIMISAGVNAMIVHEDRAMDILKALARECL